MPIFLEPDQSYPIVLRSDQHKPVESRPVFLARSQSMRSHERIARVIEALTSQTDKTAEQLFGEITDELARVLVGWNNMVHPETGPIAFSREAIYDVLSYAEARELLMKIMYNQHMEPDEKKSSE